jgi:cytidylate kinase
LKGNAAMHPPAPDPVPPDDLGETPRHGFRGERARPAPAGPAGLTVALSREAGARGGSIGRRVGRKLGWQVYDQELLEYMAQESAVTPGVLDALQAPAGDWAEARLQELLRGQEMSEHPSVVSLARVVLALAAQGRVVLIGRGAGYILPRATTLNVRIVSPLGERIAYMAQWLRLTEEEAAQRVRLRDDRRNEYLTAHFRRQAGDVHQYDLILNSSLLGEDVCAELIAQAARAREAALAPPG